MAVIDSLIVKLGLDARKFEAGMQRSRSNISAFGKNISSAGRTMTTRFTAPLVGAAFALVKLSDAFQEAENNIRAGTGATGKQLEILKKDFEAVYQSIPISAAEASNAISALNTLTGATGPVLQELTRNVGNVSRMLGENAVSNATAFGTALKQWKIPAEDGVDLMDKMFKITQNSGIGFGKLVTQLNTYGVVLQNAGFTASETAELMGNMNAAGFAWSRIGPGLNAALRKFADAGLPLRESLGEAIKRVKEAKTETEALSVATSIFGAEGAQRLSKAIRDNVFDITNLGEALKGTSGLIASTAEKTLTFGDRMTLLKNKVAQAAVPLGETLVNALEANLPAIEKFIGKIGEAITWFTNLDGETVKTALKIAGIFAAAGPIMLALGPFIKLFALAFAFPAGTIAAAIIGFTAGALAVWNVWGEDIKRIAQDVWESIRNWFSTGFMDALSGIQGGLDTAIGWFENFKNVLVGNSIVPETTEAVQAYFDDMAKGMAESTKKGTDKSLGIAKTFSSGFESSISSSLTSSITSFQSFGDIVSGIMRQVATEIIRVAIVSKLVRGIFGFFTGGASTAVTAALADGGSARAGKSYIVGERGPELFTPRSSGTVTSNENLGAVGGGSANVTFNISTIDSRGMASLLASRRGQIIGMIQAAYNDRGRDGGPIR